MKKAFIETAEINEARRAHKCGVKAALAELAPWACRFARCEGGYYAFESCDDYDTFRRQK